NINIFWGPEFHEPNGPHGQARPLAVKTGTTNDVRDLSTYGLMAKPDNPDKYPAVALGIWMGNSDHSPANGTAQIFAADGPGRVWHAFMDEYTRGWPVTDFQRPKGLVQATIDSYTGGKPGPWTRGTTNEWFINGTQPGGANQIDPAGKMYVQTCGGWAVDPTKAENPGGQSRGWTTWDIDWAKRAQSGPGVSGQLGTATAYFWGRGSW